MALRSGEQCARAIAALLGTTSTRDIYEPSEALYAARHEDSPTAIYESDEASFGPTRHPAPLELYTEHP